MLKESVFDAVVWEPEMDGDHPKWGPAEHGIHQASEGMGVMGLLSTHGRRHVIQPGDVLILNADGGVVEAMSPTEFEVRYDVVPQSMLKGEDEEK